jgi:N-methylhydantoinase B
MNGRVDPFTIEVIRNAITAIAEEMSLMIMRSARSPLLREAGDLSSALTDRSGGLIAQGRDIPAHLGIMGSTVTEFLKRVPHERLARGDVWFLNLPEVGGNHLPDVKAIRPVFYDDELQGFAVCLAHWADIGGARPGSYVPDARDIWQEGLRIPPLRLFTAAGPDRGKATFWPRWPPHDPRTSVCRRSSRATARRRFKRPLSTSTTSRNVKCARPCAVFLKGPSLERTGWTTTASTENPWQSG